MGMNRYLGKKYLRKNVWSLYRMCGKIYKIVCNKTGLCYYGSTTQTLTKRLGDHKSAYRHFLRGKTEMTTSSFKILENKNYDIYLLELVSVDCMKQRERYYIENNPCVNIIIPTRTPDEWRTTYRDKVLGYKKKWRDANKDHMKKYNEEVRKPRMEVRKMVEHI